MRMTLRSVFSAPHRAWESYRGQNSWYQFATIWSLVFLGWLAYDALRIAGL